MSTALQLRRGSTAQHASFTGAEGEVSVDTSKDTLVVHDGATAGGFPLAKESQLSGFRNRIINGSMVIDQRNAGASVTPTSGQYTLDRWTSLLSQASKYTVQKNAGSVTPPAGFTNYLGVTSSSAYSVLSGETFLIDQRIEGFNFADMGWGTSVAATVTLSFWVRSSLTGNFGGGICNSASDRSYLFSYTISSANTWEYKTITIAGDTSGTWVGATNGIGAIVRFGLGSGSTFTGTANSWQAGNLVQPTGTVSVVGTNGATFYLTGVQVEKGSVATPFEFRSIGQELALCQRYYVKFNGVGGAYMPCIFMTAVGSTTDMAGQLQLPVRMRDQPSSITVGGSAASFAGLTLDRASPEQIMVYLSASGLTPYSTYRWIGNADGTTYIAVEREL